MDVEVNNHAQMQVTHPTTLSNNIFTISGIIHLKNGSKSCKKVFFTDTVYRDMHDTTFNYSSSL